MNTSPARVKGRLLVARPELLDANFCQTVVFIARHSRRDGSIGFVMNRNLPHTLGDIALSKSPLNALKDLPLFWGGPVQTDRITLAIFRQGRSPDEIRCTLGNVEALAAVKSGRAGCWIRAFAGCAGWSSGQLQGELNEAAWTVASPHAALFDDRLLSGLWPVLATGDERWRRLVSRLPRVDHLN